MLLILINFFPIAFVFGGSCIEGLRSVAGSKFWNFWENGAFAVFSKKCLPPYGWSGSNFTAATNCTNLKIVIQSKIIEMQILEAKTRHAIKIQIFLLCQQQTILLVVNLLSHKLLTAPTALIKKGTKKVSL